MKYSDNINKEAKKGMLMVISAGMCWGTTGTIQALAPAGASPVTIGSARVFGAGLLLFLWMLSQKNFSFLRGTFKASGICIAALSLTLYQFTFFSAVRITGVAIGTMIAIGSAPALAGILGRLFFKEHLSFHWYIATFLAITGCFLMAAGGNNVFASARAGGVILAFGAALSYAFEGVGLRISGSLDPLDTVTLISILSGLMALPWLFMSDISWIFQPKGFLCVLVLSFFSTILPFILFTKGLSKITLGMGYTLSLSEPLTACILSAAMLEERLSVYGLLGAGLIFSGIITLASEKK